MSNKGGHALTSLPPRSRRWERPAAFRCVGNTYESSDLDEDVASEVEEAEAEAQPPPPHTSTAPPADSDLGQLQAFGT